MLLLLSIVGRCFGHLKLSTTTLIQVKNAGGTSINHWRFLLWPGTNQNKKTAPCWWLALLPPFFPTTPPPPLSRAPPSINPCGQSRTS